ncbi:hypothetical protein Tco_1217350 [Tanacetum coccineum]
MKMTPFMVDSMRCHLRLRFSQEYMPNVSEERAKELDELMMRMTETGLVDLMMQVGSNPALARELLGADVTEENFVERMTAIKDKKKRALADLRYRALKAVKAMSKQQLIEEYENICRRLEKDRLLSAHFHPAGSAPPLSGSAAPTSAGGVFGVPDSTISLTSQAIDSAVSHRINDFFLASDEAAQIGISRVAADPDSDDEVLAEILFRGQYISGAGVVVVDKLPDDRGEFFLRVVSDDDLELYITPLSVWCVQRLGDCACRLDVDVGLDLWRDVNLLCQSLHSDDVEDFWRTQDDWIVSSWKLYPKSSVHVLDLTNGKTVYMFIDRVYPIRATLLERMLRHKLTVPPSYCRDVVVAGSVIQMVQAGLRESYECLASAPLVDMVINPPWNLPFLGAKGLTSPEQTATAVTNSCCKDWKLLFFNVAACFVAAGYLVSAGTCFCCYSILLLREDLSRNLELTESKPIVPADSSSSIPADNVPAGSSSSIPADYVSAGHIAVNPAIDEKTKHFNIDVHLVREKVASGLIRTVKVDIKSQVADILRKALGTYQHTFLGLK